MRSLVITTVSLAMLTLYACSDSDTMLVDDTAGSSGSGAGAGTAGGAGAAGALSAAGSTNSGAGTPGNAEAGADDGSSAGAVGTAGDGSANTAGIGAGGGNDGVAGDGSVNMGGVGNDGTAGGSETAGIGGGRQIPAPPSGVTIDTTTNAVVVGVTWIDNANDETGFNVYLSTDDTEPATPTATVGADVTEFKLTQVMGGQIYRAWVEASNASGTSAAAQATAASATSDLTWDTLSYDEATDTVHLAVEDSFGYLSDEFNETALYAYHSTLQGSMGASLAIDPAAPTIAYPAASSGIDIGATNYFWVEARGIAGSLFSLRSLSPAFAVTNLQATLDATSAALSWDGTPSATSYEVYYGTSSVADATRLSDTTATTASVSPLTASTQYVFWVRANTSAIGGPAFPGAFATVQGTSGQ
jgi:hypothetical protein